MQIELLNTVVPEGINWGRQEHAQGGWLRRVREMAPIRQQQNKNKTEEEDRKLNFSSNNDTSITSPFQRIPSFLDDDDESEFENGNTEALPEENEFGQLNRAQESQSKRKAGKLK